MNMASTTGLTYVRAGAGDNDIKASNANGSLLDAGAGDDVLRGGKKADILVGGAGDDEMYGGGGGDQFRFFGNEIDGASDIDRIYDLDFSEGDTLVFGNYDGLFQDADGLNAFDGGDAAIISSFEGLVSAVENSNGRITTTFQSNGVLLVHMQIGDQVQTLYITNGVAGYQAAAGEVSA
jgi:Ca2+-binding RTX toxin-like protein